MTPDSARPECTCTWLNASRTRRCFDVTDTFHLGFEGARIVSVRVSSNDPPEFDQAMEWVQRERAELVDEPCKNSFEGRPTPHACVRAMVQGFREYAALRRS